MLVFAWDASAHPTTSFRDTPSMYEATGSLSHRVVTSPLPVQVGPFAVDLYVLEVATRTPASAATVSAPASAATASAPTAETPTLLEVPEHVAPEERLSFTREWLSMNVSQLAAALDVNRPTVYDWLSGEVVPHAHNARRIKQLYDLARAWYRRTGVPLRGLLSTPLADDQSLLNLVSGPTPDFDAASAVLDVAARVRDAQDRQDPHASAALGSDLSTRERRERRDYAVRMAKIDRHR